MTDNNMQEQEIRTSDEHAVNPEVESRPVVTVLSRGENTYLRYIAEQFTKDGYIVDRREIPDEKVDNYLQNFEDDEADPETELLGGQIKSGVVVTDKTLGHFGVAGPSFTDLIVTRAQSEGRKIIWGRDAYSYLRNSFIDGIAEDIERGESPLQLIGNRFKPLFDEIRAKGKIPVFLVDHMNDHASGISMRLTATAQRNLNKELYDLGQQTGHSYNMVGFTGEDKYNVAQLYADIFKSRFDIPSIDRLEDLAEWDGWDTFSEKEVLILLDHHNLKGRDSYLSKAYRFGQEVDIAFICPCDITENDGEEGHYKGEGTPEGFKVFKLEWGEDSFGFAYKLLKEHVDKSMAEISGAPVEARTQEPATVAPMPVQKRPELIVEENEGLGEDLIRSLDRTEKLYGNVVRKRMEAEYLAGRIPNLSQIRQELSEAESVQPEANQESIQTIEASQPPKVSGWKRFFRRG
jgi:hypothetical protein